MKELYDIQMGQATEYLVGEIAYQFDVTKKLAKKLLANALMYNVVREEVLEQVAFLLEREEYAEEE